jgi:tRNA pseudouridine13 synthase
MATVTSDRSLRTKIHHDVRRIFNSKIESSTDKDGAMILSAAIPSSRRPANQPGRYDNQRGRGKLGWEDRGGEYLHFTIYKENKDTMEVISFLARQMKANVKIFQFAGTKDRRGVTVQRASAHRVEAERLAGQNRMLRNACVGDFEYQKHGLELGDLKGNEFVITLRDCKWEDHQNLTLTEKLSAAKEAVSKSLRDLHERGYFNYYGLQRFGTFSTRTDTIGLKILQGDFKGAVEAILQYSPESLAAAQDTESTELISTEDKARAEAIHVFQSTGRVSEALEKLPRKYSAESNIIRHLGRHHDDYAGALQMVQRNMKLMYVHAYQSLVWNFAVGERWRLFGDKVVEGDLVMVNEHKEKAGTAIIDDVDADGEIVIQPAGDDRAHDIDDVFERARTLTAEEAASGTYSIFDVVLPQPGFDVIYGNMTDFYKTFMASERGGGLDPLEMRRKQRDYSLSGSYRKVLARIAAGYEFQVRAYSNDDEQFVETDLAKIQAGTVGPDGNLMVAGKEAEEGDKMAVILKLQLGSSQYATMALRELMKGGLSAYKPDFGGGR